jgi:2-keto-3-deoxy-6-phosphogluconate aldolase
MPIRKLVVLNRIIDTGLIAIIRADVADHAARIAACAKEVSAFSKSHSRFRAPRRSSEALSKEYEGEMVVGAGTVLDLKRPASRSSPALRLWSARR